MYVIESFIHEIHKKKKHWIAICSKQTSHDFQFIQNRTAPKQGRKIIATFDFNAQTVHFYLMLQKLYLLETCFFFYMRQKFLVFNKKCDSSSNNINNNFSDQSLKQQCHKVLLDFFYHQWQLVFIMSAGNAKIGQPAPQFKATAVVDGQFKDVQLSDYRGEHQTLHTCCFVD